MQRIDVFNGVKALVYKDLMEFKNKVRYALHHPAGILEGVIKILIPVIMVAGMSSVFSGKILNESFLSFDIAGIAGAVIMLLLLVIFFFNLKKAVDNYYPAQYSAADVNWLFTSPLGSRLIYAASMGKQLLGSVPGGVLMGLSFLLLQKIFPVAADSADVASAFIGVGLFAVIVQNLKFFLYSLSKRFNSAALLKILVFVFPGIIAVCFIIALYGSTDILQKAVEVVGGRVFESIPVIGWTKKLIFSVFTGSLPVCEFIMLALCTVFMLFVAVFLATDYYEEAAVSTERITRLRAASKRDDREEIQRLVVKKKAKAGNIQVNWGLKKAYAFLWKDIVINKRKSKGIVTETVKYLSMVVLGGVLGYVFRNYAYNELAVFITVFGIILKKSNSSFLEGLEYELRKNYLFLLPGSVRNKMLAVNMLPVIKTLIRNSLLILPMVLFLKIAVVQLFSLWVVLNAINLMGLFTAVAIKEILPSGNKKSFLQIFLRGVFDILTNLPAAGMGVLVFYLFHNLAAALLVYGICSLLVIIGLLYVSGSLFNRLELQSQFSKS